MLCSYINSQEYTDKNLNKKVLILSEVSMKRWVGISNDCMS